MFDAVSQSFLAADSPNEVTNRWYDDLSILIEVDGRLVEIDRAISKEQVQVFFWLILIFGVVIEISLIEDCSIGCRAVELVCIVGINHCFVRLIWILLAFFDKHFESSLLLILVCVCQQRILILEVVDIWIAT